MATARSEDVRRRLLETASRLFYENGIGATGIDRILAESGVAKMTLYKAFGSKEALVLEYLHQRYVGFVPSVREAVTARASDPRKRLLAIFDVLGDWFRQPDFRGCPLLNAAIEFSDASHPARDLVERMTGELRDYFCELAAEAGFKDPRAVGEQLCILAHGAVAWAQITRNDTPAAQARQMAEVFLRQAQ